MTKFTTPSSEIALIAAQLDEIRKLNAEIGELRSKPLWPVRGDLLPTPRAAKNIHHDIQCGSIVTGWGCTAEDSWALDGAFSCSISDFLARFEAAARFCEGKKASSVIVRMLADDPDGLRQRGRYAAWRRRYVKYWAGHNAWLAVNPEMRMSGKWRKQRMTAGQSELVRVTAAALELDIPVGLNRGAAHDWIDEMGANLRYRIVQP